VLLGKKDSNDDDFTAREDGTDGVEGILRNVLVGYTKGPT